MRFGSNIIKYYFTSPPPKLEVKVNEIHGNIMVQTDSQIKYYIQADVME